MYTVCINLKERKDKKTYMKKVFKKQNITENFFKAKLHKNPKRGCLESHLAVIKDAIKKNKKQMLILEDDVVFKRHISSLLSPPEDWDMLYLGGTVKHIISNENPNFPRVQAWTTHAYMINLSNQELVNDILKAEEYENEIDNFYVENIHPKYNVYMVNPMMCIQKDGYSDIEKTNVDYSFMEKTLTGLQKPRHSIENGGYRLKLKPVPDEKLPKVSVVTITYNRRHFYPLSLTNWENIMYPRDKLEWIVVEDPSNSMWDGVEKFARYIKLDKRLSIPEKRNIACEKANGDIIVFMDDDDYYPPESVLSRVRILLEYNCDIVGSSQLGLYNVYSHQSSYISDGNLSLAEASMGFWKRAWLQQKFDETQETGEYRGFLQGRINHCIDCPFVFTVVALQHKTNTTNKKQNPIRDLDFSILFNDEFKRNLEKTVYITKNLI